MTVVIDGTSGITTPSDTISGDLTFTGTGNRITGDFSNATLANRVMFQTSTANGNTSVRAIPNGTSVTANYTVNNNSDPTNSSSFSLIVNSTESQLNSGISGTGTYLPMTFYTGGSERMRIDTSGNLQFNSGYGSVATAYGCRAWVNFNGTGTVAIRASGNVTSITDVGTGVYTVNLTTAMPDTSYAVSALAGAGSSTNRLITGWFDVPTTSAIQVRVNTAAFAAVDTEYVSVVIFR